MPVTRFLKPHEYVEGCIEQLDKFLATRRGGVYIPEKMVAAIVADTFGLVMQPGPATAVYEQVISHYCRHRMVVEVDAENIQKIEEVFTSLQTNGHCGFQSFPLMFAYFADQADMSYFNNLIFNMELTPKPHE